MGNDDERYRSDPKPSNFDAMVRAYASGDRVQIAREIAAYNEQLRLVGAPPIYAPVHDPLDVPDRTEPKHENITA